QDSPGDRANLEHQNGCARPGPFHVDIEPEVSTELLAQTVELRGESETRDLLGAGRCPEPAGVTPSSHAQRHTGGGSVRIRGCFDQQAVFAEEGHTIQGRFHLYLDQNARTGEGLRVFW